MTSLLSACSSFKFREALHTALHVGAALLFLLSGAGAIFGAGLLLFLPL